MDIVTAYCKNIKYRLPYTIWYNHNPTTNKININNTETILYRSQAVKYSYKIDILDSLIINLSINNK